MVYFTPCHDPQGLWNDRLLKALPFLQTHFTAICLSFTPLSAKENPSIISELEQRGVFVRVMEEGTTIGDHMRGALSLALEKSTDNNLFYLNLDRMLFAISSYKEKFLHDLVSYKQQDLHLFHRTERAWNTHPNNYRDMEQGLDLIAQHLIGFHLELGICAFIVSRNHAHTMLAHSNENTFAVIPEWILSVKHNNPSVSEADWLSWEDPYIEKRDAKELKYEREQSMLENKKRLTNVKAFIDFLENKM